MRAGEAEATLRGRPPEEATLQAAARAAQATARPISDQRASARYRTMMVETLTRQALRQAVALAGQG
jgi:carbon-monoxide dehydrogenase medium subunit